VRFDVFADQGDCRSHRPACRVIRGIAADRPDFVLGAGDLSYADDNGPAAADRWARDVQRYSTSVPLMVTPGNHEWAQGDKIGSYKGRFSLPDDRREDYYSFSYGPVHVVALPERYVPMRPGSEFLRWLAADLQASRARPGVVWVVAFGHRPFYSSGRRHGPDPRYRSDVLPVLQRGGVDVVFSGHEHNYERTLPLRGGKPAAGSPHGWEQGRGVAFVVTGGGGARVYDDYGPWQPWDAVRRVTHQHVRVDADDRMLRVTAQSDDGDRDRIDEFTITAGARR
jgi:hypothetical protein